MIIIYDEKKLAENVFQNGFQEGGFTWKEGILLGKYFRYELGFGDVKTKKLLIEYALSHDKYFNYVRNRKMVGKILKRSKDLFFDTGSVEITESEVLKVREIRNFRQQKIIIVILLLSKRKTNNGYINLKDWPLVKKIVSRKITNSDIQTVFTMMYQLGMSTPYGASQKILFLDNDSKIVIRIKDNKDAVNIVAFYRDYCGGDLGYCRCGKEFIKNNPRQVLCKECKSKSRLEKYRRYNEKRKTTTH